MQHPFHYDPEDDLSRRIYLHRCDGVVRAFTDSVQQLERFSERYNKKFFSIPLKWAKKLRWMSVAVQSALQREHINYANLLDMWYYFLQLKKTFFNPIADVANKHMYPGGFTSRNMLLTYNLWGVIESQTFHYELSDHVNFAPPASILHKVFMEPFAIFDIDIFRPISDNWRQFFDDPRYVFRRVIDVENEQRAMLRPPTPPPAENGTSRSASPDMHAESDEEEEDLTYYIGMEDGEFGLFEQISAF
uniref:PMD domain-containing protein n=1 Tax=Caenorhabditis tropicalis TaxID=1561998 RepID=A0A1I7URZ8_9PELO